MSKCFSVTKFITPCSLYFVTLFMLLNLIAALFKLRNVCVKIFPCNKRHKKFNLYSGDGGKEKLIPLIQGPSDTRDLHSSKWLNESRKPESLLAPDLVAFTIQIPRCMDYCHNSGKCKTLVKLISDYIFLSKVVF